MKPKVLVLAKSIKSYWATPFAKNRVDKFIVSRSSNILRLFITAVKGYVTSEKFDVVIAADPRIGTFYGFLKTVFRGKTPIIIDQLILGEKTSFLAFLKDIFYKFSFQSVNIAIVNSSYEKELFIKRLSKKTLFIFLPILAEDFWFIPNLQRGRKTMGVSPWKFINKEKERNYIFSGGGEKRDYKTLFKAVSNLKQNFKIVVFSKQNLLGAKEIGENCEIIYKVPNEEYVNLIGKSKFVVIPLLKSSKSAGQTTLVQAMCQGKAVIIADNPTVADYANKEKEAIYYKAENHLDLEEKINQLVNNDEKRIRIEKNARNKAIREFSCSAYDQRMEEVIKKCLKI